ncbi:MAG TPA: hypothetical protein DHV36_13030 [Desulfobacteraceae bacterium]|nr:hypothetical protein [Desulfobacteraceae bacterium]
MTEKIDYVYLTSAPHSGSTLIACLLAAHPMVSTVGEFSSPFSPSEKCSCGSRYGDCNFWADWKQQAADAGIAFDPGKQALKLAPEPGSLTDSFYYYQFSKRAVARIRDTLFKRMFPLKTKTFSRRLRTSVDLAGILCGREKTRIFLDTSKNPFQIRFLRDCPNINLKVIFLVRDGRAVMNSLLSKETIYTPQSAAETWRWCNKTGQGICDTYVPEKNLFHLKLEALCDNPGDTLAQLGDFLELDGVPDLDFNSDYHIVGNYMRHTFDGIIRPHDEKWRQHLSRENLDIFNRIGGRMNREFGYMAKGEGTS